MKAKDIKTSHEKLNSVSFSRLFKTKEKNPKPLHVVKTVRYDGILRDLRNLVVEKKDENGFVPVFWFVETMKDFGYSPVNTSYGGFEQVFRSEETPDEIHVIFGWRKDDKDNVQVMSVRKITPEDHKELMEYSNNRLAPFYSKK